MLHAEQWGLEHDLLYALANCPGNEPMLLAPCNNDLVLYQSMTTGGMGSEVLHAGTPLGLMAYLFGQWVCVLWGTKLLIWWPQDGILFIFQ